MTLIRTVVLVAVVAGAGEARAQTGAPSGEILAGAAVGVSLFASSIVLGVGSLHEARMGRPRWATWSGAVLGVGNLGLGITCFVLGATRRGEEAWYTPGALALLHGVWNLGASVFSFTQATTVTGQVVPLVLSGRTASGTGKRWTGLGLQVAL